MSFDQVKDKEGTLAGSPEPNMDEDFDFDFNEENQEILENSFKSFNSKQSDKNLNDLNPI